MYLTESPCLDEDISHFKMLFVPHSACRTGEELSCTISGHKENGKKCFFYADLKERLKMFNNKGCNPSTMLSQTLCGRLE